MPPELPGRRARRRAVLLAAALAAAVALGCGLDPDGSAPGPGGTDGGPADSGPAGSGNRDPDAAAKEFADDVNGAVGVAEDYWTERFRASGSSFRPIREVIPYRRDGEVSCGGQPMERNNAAYCTAGDFIAYDVNWAAAAFQQIGDAFLYFLLGHEYAHGIQVRLGLRYKYTIGQELQADCMAGAYIGDSVKAGRLELEDGDIDELERGLVAVADDPGQPWFAPGSHGSARQRTTSFFNGYRRSLGACGLD